MGRLSVSGETYCNIIDVCECLIRHFTQFTSYGIKREFVHGQDGTITEGFAIKPRWLFRGQTKAYDTLRPLIYRKYPPLSTWQERQFFRIGDDSLLMPHPHYCEDLERDFYFSCIKAAEIISGVSASPDYA